MEKEYPTPEVPPIEPPDSGMLLAKYVLRSFNALGLQGADTLACIIGISKSSAALVLRGEMVIHPSCSSGILALQLIGVHHGLSALLGQSDELPPLWMRNYNKGLDAVPAELIEKSEGLSATLDYLNAMRSMP